MHNKTTPDAAAEAIITLMHALIDISCTAATAEKHITREPEYTGAIIPHSLAYAQLTADVALNEAKAILIADCENGGVMRDDRYFKSMSHAENALTNSECLREILLIWLYGLSDAPEDERQSNLACAFISLLDTVIVELNKAIEIHDKKINAE
ncbi:hypothetical protein ACSD62_004559 [Escherichia coli]